MQGIQLLGMGKCLPARMVKNEDLTQHVDTSDEWIRSRTGIVTRYFSDGETHTELAACAARRALANAGIRPDQIGLCIVATISADYATPSCACLVQACLGLPNDIPAFDINAACSGFVYALNVASSMLGSHNLARPYALVIGAEQLTRMMNMQDRSTCILFGDGAAAAVIRASDAHRFISILGSEGNKEALNTPGLMRDEQYIHMDGKTIFRFAVRTLGQAIDQLEEASGVKAEEVDYIVCHQANLRIIERVIKQRRLNPEKCYINLDRYGNTSGASIALALADLMENGKLQSGTRLFLIGFGSGLTWGAAYMEL